jgi:hypothetical protein
MKNTTEKQSYKSNERNNLSILTRNNSTRRTVSTSSLKPTEKTAPVLTQHTSTTTVRKTMTLEQNLNHNEDDAIHEPWMQRYSTYTFEQLHTQVYKFIDQIVSQDLHATHPQVIRWKQLHETSRKYPMKERMSWRHMQLCLGIDDLSQYRDYIFLSFPTITNIIRLKTNNKIRNTLDFGILDNHTDDEEIANQHSYDGSSITTYPEDTTEDVKPADTSDDVHECHNNTKHLHQLLHHILNIIDTTSNDADDNEDLKTWQEWQQQGLTSTSTFEEIKNLCQITTFAEFYTILRTSLFLKPYMHFTWKNKYFTYTCKMPQRVQVHNINALQTLHALAYPKIQVCNILNIIINATGTFPHTLRLIIQTTYRQTTSTPIHECRTST